VGALRAPAGRRRPPLPGLEKCFYYWGDDIGPSDTPLEAGLAFCVRLDKGDFVGRDALLRQRDQGLRRKLVPLVLDGEACVLWGGEAVVADGQVVGRVRSGGYGHTIGSNVALAYLPMRLTAAGTAVTVESFDRLVPAEVRSAPLWDPSGARVRS
jgi:glycine cleavage system aminomethyltransferase T